MNIYELCKDVKLGNIPGVEAELVGTEFLNYSLEEIRVDKALYYRFIAFCVSKIGL